jgi:hypothetical protein
MRSIYNYKALVRLYSPSAYSQCPTNSIQIHTRDLGLITLQENQHSPQVILERAHEIDIKKIKNKKLPFEGKCSNVVIDSHMNGRLLSVHV